jgi:hypothetical protein
MVANTKIENDYSLPKRTKFFRRIFIFEIIMDTGFEN